MPKDKSSKAQSRKKQETDVSDALFHVTPQPTIDIFEVLGGAINVQTAAFLTGKVDRLDAPLESLPPIEQLDPINQVNEPTAAPQSNSPANTTLEKQVRAKDMAQSDDTDDLVEPSAKSKQTVLTEAPCTEPPLRAPNGESDTLTKDNTVLHEKAINEAQDAEHITEVHSIENQANIASSAPSLTHKSIKQNAPSEPDNHASLIIPAAQQESMTDNAIPHASNHAIFHDTANISDTSMASYDQKNSMPNIQHDSSHASTGDSQVNSIASSIAKITVPSIETSTAKNTSAAPCAHPENSIADSIPSSTLTFHKNPNQAPLCNPLISPTYTPKQESNLLSQLTKREEELLQFLRHHHGQIVSYSQMLKSLNWRESQRCTARNIIARFETNGIIQRQRVQGTRSQGYLFTICDQVCSTTQQPPYSPYQTEQIPLNQNHIPSTPYSMQNSIAIFNSNPNQQPAITSMVNSIENSTQKHNTNSTPTSMPSYIDKIDRLIQSIWQSDQETITACWPAVAAAGFRSAHLRQLQSIFELQGFEPDTVPLGLRYLDWQLEQGPLTNARGEVIEDPVAYWLSSMRRHGYYSRPKGYLDPLLEAKRLLAEEEQAKLDLQAQLAQTRQQNEQVAEDQRCEALFTALMAQGFSHPLWSAFYQSLPQMFRQKVDAEGPDVLAKKFGMVKALLKELV